MVVFLPNLSMGASPTTESGGEPTHLLMLMNVGRAFWLPLILLKEWFHG
jgi:hypothetical protein